MGGLCRLSAPLPHLNPNPGDCNAQEKALPEERRHALRKEEKEMNATEGHMPEDDRGDYLSDIAGDDEGAPWDCDLSAPGESEVWDLLSDSDE
jgi:hypothetical protein